ISGNDRGFAFVSLPAGFEIPRPANGSAAFFQRIDKTKAEQSFQFELKRSSASGDHPHLLLLSDAQIQDEYDAALLLTVAAQDVQKTVANLNDPNLFGIGCGDLVYDKLELFEEYNQSVQMYNTPFFQVVGNHDLDFGGRSDSTTTETFKGHYGP